MNAKILKIPVLALALMLVAVACGGGAAPTSAPPTSAPAATSAPQATTAPSSGQPTTSPSTQATSAPSTKRFDGVTVTIYSASGGNGEYFETAAKSWEAATGGKIALNLVPYSDLQDKLLTALGTGGYLGDILNVPDGLSGDLMGGGYVEPVPDASKAAMNWDDLFPAYRERQLDWGGVTYGYPWDGDIHMLTYRKDLVDDPKFKDAFKSKYGYDLQMPSTWKQYRDVAEFFTNTDWGDGKKHYGFAELPLRKGHGMHGFISRAVAYAKVPGDPAFYFNPDTMDAEINNPGFVQALQDWVDDLAFAPPNFLNMGFYENVQAFAGGLVPLDINWADMGPAVYDPKASVVNGKAFYGPLPGNDKVYNYKTKQWETPAGGNHPAYAAFGGWINVVPKNSKNKEAAIALATFLGTPQAMEQASLTPGDGVNPARKSTLADVTAWVQGPNHPGFATSDEAKNYLDTIAQILDNDNMVFQLRIPGFAEYQDAFEIAISKALAKQATPQQALDEAAKTWNQITDRIGRDKQKQYYRQSIGLPQ